VLARYEDDLPVAWQGIAGKSHGRLLISEGGLQEPFNTLALMCVCFGLRISEALALKWADVDWLNGTLQVERGIVQQIVDDVKTDDSRRTLTIASDLLDVLKLWKQATQFSAPEDWIFASSGQIGRLPWSASPQSRIQAYVPYVARFGRYACRRAAEAHASRGHPHDHEHLRRCGHE